jgi:hypothetical protein
VRVAVVLVTEALIRQRVMDRVCSKRAMVEIQGPLLDAGLICGIAGFNRLTQRALEDA